MWEFRFLFSTKEVAFSQGVAVERGYWSCPAMQCGATVTTALTHDLPGHIRFSREQYHACAGETPVCPGIQKALSRN